MRRIAGVLVVLLMASGCSSVHRVAQVCPQPHVAVPVTVNTPSASNRAAIAFGRHTLDEAVVPSDAASFTGPAPPGLQCPFLQGPAIGNLVFAHRFWTVNEAPHTLSEWFAVHVPHGFVADGGPGTLGGGVVIWYVTDHLAELPANISEALLQLSIVGPASGPAVLRVDSTVGWTAPRSADEFVSTRDRVVVVTVIHTRQRNRAGKRVVVADATRVQRIASTFNHLTVEPPFDANGGGCHGPASPDPVSYQAAFAESATAAPDLVATVGGGCAGVGVTVNGRAALILNDEPKGALGYALAHVLGLAEPDFG